LGLKIVEGKSMYLRNILACFIDHGFFSKESDACEALATILLSEKDTIGYANKYDMLTLYDYYTIIALANDSSTTYEMFIRDVATKKYLPFDHIPEIILRVLGRYLNVIVNLYTFNLNSTVINNALDNDETQYIMIYQYSPDTYYNIIAVDKEFEPVGKNIIHKLNFEQINFAIQQEYSNDVTDFVSV